MESIQSHDLARIWSGIYEADIQDRLIDDATARRIAGQLHGGQRSAMYSLASCGAVDYERLKAELRDGYDQADEVTQQMTDRLASYCVEHDGRGPVEGWYQLTNDEGAL